MDDLKADKEFTILGHRIRLREEKESVNPTEVVGLVNRKLNTLKQKSPTLDNSQAAILVALELAATNIELQREYQIRIEAIEASAKKAFRMIEEVSPSTL